MTLRYTIDQLLPYINWAYYYYAWQLIDHAEQQRMRLEAVELLRSFGGRYGAQAVLSIERVHAEDDDIVVDCQPQPLRLPMLRQQSGTPCLSLADFVCPQGDTLALFATSVDQSMVSDQQGDAYASLVAQLLADRLAEAAAELLHLEVRTRYWGYAPDEQLTIAELHQEHFQGIRPAVGYPSLPDASLNFLLDRRLCLQQIGITLTESGAMQPHASVSGLMFSHPQARYFAVGKIGTDQLADYARRRGFTIEKTRKFLAANL